MGNWTFTSLLRNRSTAVGAVIGLALGGGVAAAAITGLGGQTVGYDGASLIHTGNLTPIKPPPGAPMSFADMIAQVSPAVVSIETKGKMKIDDGEIPGLPGLDVPGTGGDGQKEQEVRGAGSGFFISQDGYIVTNNHVIEGADDIQVVLTNKQKLKATVVGRDIATDLAVLKVEGKDFPYVTFELQHKPRVGDWVVAVGNPFGFSGTATAGIVSAITRDISDGGADYVDFLQIDAAINRGNSGGPTFDLYGRVIGVNAAIVTPSGANAGIGFAIPADVANKITQQLMKGVTIQRGYIGVTIEPVNDEDAAALGITDTTGAFINDTTKGGPADKAGVQVGDIVKSVDGQPVASPTELTRRIADVAAGEKVTLGIDRSGKMVQLVVTAALRPSEDVLNKTLNGGSGGDDSAGPTAGGSAPIIGLSVKALTPEARKAFSIGSDVQGVVITDVDPNSDGGEKGLKPGDVIVRANNQPVTNAADFAAIIDTLKKAGRPSVLLVINRDGRNTPLPVDLKAETAPLGATKP